MEELGIDREVGVEVVVVTYGTQRVVIQIVHGMIGHLPRSALWRLTSNPPVKCRVEGLVPHHFKVLGTLAGGLDASLLHDCL